MTIVLVGMMGAGKSTIGRRLAILLGMRFFDVDKEIEKLKGRSISEIFELEGESEFRIIEKKMTLDLIQNDGVVSLGGGAFVDPETRNACLQKATVVYIKVNEEELIRRVNLRPGARPMLASNSEEKIHELLKTRGPIYEMAHVVFEEQHEDADLAAKSLEKQLRKK